MKDAQCHNCQRTGHYSSQCFRKAVHTVQDGGTLDTAFLNTVSTDRSKAWFATISISGREMPFKLDTGAEVTAVSKTTWQMLGEPLLQPPDKQLWSSPTTPRGVRPIPKTPCLQRKGSQTPSLCCQLPQDQPARASGHLSSTWQPG